jgi:hypothetical protein
MADVGQGDRQDRVPSGARRRMPLAQRIRAADSYGLLLALIFASLIGTAAASHLAAGRVSVVVLQGGVLVYAIWTSRAGRRVLRGSLIAVPIVIVAAAVLTGSHSDSATAAVRAVSTLLSLATIGAIVRRIGAHPRVDGSTILGALCIYLLIGTFFANLFGTVAALGNAPFFVDLAAPQYVDFLYFSFVTMTTVGYGDLTAATDLGRMLAASQAVIGQLYLVSVVALVIGNVGRERHRS